MSKLLISFNSQVISLSNQSITQRLEQSTFPICHLTFIWSLPAPWNAEPISLGSWNMGIIHFDECRVFELFQDVASPSPADRNPTFPLSGQEQIWTVQWIIASEYIPSIKSPLIQNPPPNLGIKTEISRLWTIPDHQEGIRCKAPRSDNWGVWSNTPQGGAIEGNAADDAFMVDQGYTKCFNNVIIAVRIWVVLRSNKALSSLVLSKASGNWFSYVHWQFEELFIRLGGTNPSAFPLWKTISATL